MKIDLRFGDDIERIHREWISLEIPEYEILWSRFIGHDGCGKPLKVKLTKLSEAERERFYQAHYTALTCLVTLRDFALSYKDQLGVVPNVQAYQSALRDLRSFMANLGSLRDLFHKMDTVLKLGGKVSDKFDNLYSQRNRVLHGSLPPSKIEDGLLKIPVPSGREVEGGWTEESSWSQAGEFKYKFIAQFFEDSYDTAKCHFRVGLMCFLDRLKEIEPSLIEPLSVNQPVPPDITGLTNFGSVSGQYIS